MLWYLLLYASSLLSAYCGGMWLAAVKMFINMARELGQPSDEEEFTSILEKGKASFEDKLWNGKLFAPE